MTELADYLQSRLEIEGLHMILERQVAALAAANAHMRLALEEIGRKKKLDAVAAASMQAIARAALSNGERS
jgi:hypothetical protein